MQATPPFEQTFMTICVQYLRILLSSFGEKDFQRYTLEFAMFKFFGYYFTDNVGGATI